MKALFRIVVTLIIALLFIIPAQAQEPVVHAILFYSQNCPHCYKVITEDLPPLVEKYGNQLVIAGIDTYTEQGNLLYQSAIENFHIPQERLGVPTLIIGETVLVGSLEIPKQLPVLIEAGLTSGGIAWPDWPLFQQLLEAQEEEDSTSNLPPETEQVSPDQVTDTLEATSTVETDHDDQQTPALAKTNVAENASILPNSSKDEQADEEGSDKPEGQHPIIGTQIDETTFNAASLTLSERFAHDKVGNTFSVVLLVTMVFSAIGVGIKVSQLSIGLKPWPLWVVPLLLLIGMLVAIYMSYVEVTQADVVCGPVGDCETVQQSAYARLFGVLPIGVFGFIGYLAIGFTWILANFGKVKSRNLSILFTWLLCVFGALFSIYLTFLEPFVIGATCAWCLTSAVVMNLLLWATTAPAIQAWKNIRSSQI